MEQTVLLRATDTASTNYGELDGEDLCGLRTYTVSADNDEFWSLSVATITLLATRPTIVSLAPYVLTASVTLDNYPDIDAATLEINVYIQDTCPQTSLEFDPEPVDMLVDINEET